jgi:molybdopterin/thiamine biosynthesis adenylyltransferase
VNIDKFIKAFTSGFKDQIEPVFIDISSNLELETLMSFSQQHDLGFHSPINNQLEEYKEIYTMFHGNALSSYDQFIKDTVQKDSNVYGEFVYFNWGQKSIFNVVSHSMHYELLTWRNKEKLNDEEQKIISNKTVGVIGASVGSFATKILSKSGFQHIQLAEIKEMKPSNATRMFEDSIRNYGVHKLFPLIQGIYEFNPYTKVNYSTGGLQEENIHELLYMNGRPLDIIIDAADDGKTKILIRNFCKKHKVPLIHGFDEKGIFIIQRYDRPELNTYHEPDFTFEELDKLKKSNPKKYMMSLLEFIPGGYEHLSIRQKETIEGILKKTRGGFSQLAWEAALFSSYISKAVIDVALGEEIAGFQQIDLDELITRDLSRQFPKAS